MNDPSLTLNLLPQNSTENKRHVPYLGLTLPSTLETELGENRSLGIFPSLLFWLLNDLQNQHALKLQLLDKFIMLQFPAESVQGFALFTAIEKTDIAYLQGKAQQCDNVLSLLQISSKFGLRSGSVCQQSAMSSFKPESRPGGRVGLSPFTTSSYLDNRKPYSSNGENPVKIS